MYNNQEIASLSREELANALQKFQLKSGPITNTTRRVFENRLKAYLEKINAEVESKEDKENWVVIDNKCCNGNHIDDEKHGRSNSDENNDSFIQSSVNENCMTQRTSNCDKNYLTELTVIKTERSYSGGNCIEKRSNADSEASDSGKNRVETIINIESGRTSCDLNHTERKTNGVVSEQSNSDESKITNSVASNNGITATDFYDDHIHKNITNCSNEHENKIGLITHDTILLDNILTSEVDSTLDAVVLNTTQTSKTDITHNAIVLNDRNTSAIDFTHNAVVLNNVQTLEVDTSHDAIVLNNTQTVEVEDILKSSNVNDNKTISCDQNTTSTTPSSNTPSGTPSSNTTPTQTISSETISNGTSSHEDTNMPTHYYAVWIPYSSARVGGNKPIICESQQDALNKMKGFKGSRFKMFESKVEAENFSLSELTQAYEKLSPYVAPVSEPKEKLIKVPTFHEVIKFRQHIEKFKTDELEACLANPRYLISSSDIPVILQEGSRMNAVHIATKCNRVKVLKILFSYLQSDDFLRLVYTNASDTQLQFRKNHLIDLYLNTPEKILCDTPLHLACKFGYMNIVKYLLTFKQLKVDAHNTDRKPSAQVICDRVNARSLADRDKIKNEILTLFEEKAYVPLYDNDDGMQSKIGRPILTISPNDIYSSTVKVKAYAGPMSPEKASTVFEKWKKSPRNRAYSVIACSDYEKGMERIGRSIALNENVPFTEYWCFLNKFTNLTTSQGLKKLEKYLKSKYTAAIQNCKKDNCISVTTTKKYSKHNRRSTEVAPVIDKHPIDIKRKLTFDDTKSPPVTNENTQVVDKNTPVQGQSIINRNTLASSRKAIKMNQNLPVKDQDVGISNKVKQRLVLDEKVSAINNIFSSPDEVKNCTSNTLDAKPGDTVPKSVNADFVSSESKATGHKIEDLNTGTFWDDMDLGNNIIDAKLEDKKISENIQNKNITLRCTSTHCLCDTNISEECYLSEKFSCLIINSNEEEATPSSLVDDGNVDMDLVNQSVSFHLETNSSQTSHSNDDSKETTSDKTHSNHDMPVEVISDKILCNNNNINNIRPENMQQTLVDSPVPSSSFISPVPSLFLFDSPKLPPSSFNSPAASLSTFDNKISIPGIINLPVKLDNNADQKCYPEQHAVFINGDQPSKHDLDVLRAIGSSTEIDNFPHIRRWKCLVESFPDTAKSSWPSPGSPRYSKISRRTLWTA